jgi:hypothetical protein
MEETAMRWGRWVVTGLISVLLVWFVWWHVNRTMQPAHAELISASELLQ